MPKATLTSRVLKNKATGLEIQVPTFSVHKDLLSNIVHYQVVLASNLACFKSPSHKESDVVQYSVERKFNEFEDLKSKIAGQFPSTMLPPLNKKSIIVNDTVLRERRASLDHFMKCIASMPKLSTCVPLLVFLGVDRHRAKKYNRGEPLDNKAATGAGAEDHSQIGNDEGEDESESNNPIMFGEDEDSGNEDMFGDDGGRDGADGLFGNDEEEEGDDSRPGNVKIFEGQDLKPDLTEDDEKDFTAFIPDAILTKTKTVRTQEPEEDNSDLFQIEDDLDNLFVKPEAKKTPEEDTQPQPPPPSTTTPSQKTPPKKPSPPPKKPSVPSKPKPQIAGKPKNLTSSTSSSPSSSTSDNKPSIPQKPKPSFSSTSSSSSSSTSAPKSDNISKPKEIPSATSSSNVASSSVDNLGQDDIMKYLQDNLDSNAEEVDLFS